jgi:hypothetical protein
MYIGLTMFLSLSFVLCENSLKDIHYTLRQRYDLATVLSCYIYRRQYKV